MSKLSDALAPGREPTPYERFRAQVEKLRPEIAGLVGKENVERFLRVCLNAVQANPDVLAQPARKSLLLACMKAAQDRLLPDGREAVFNVYNTKIKKPGGKEEWEPRVQYLPMVGGLIKKLYDSGQVTFVDAVAVREEDDFEYTRGDDPRIIHRPYVVGDKDPGKVVAAYVVAKLKNGEVKREVMSRRDIEQVRLHSKTPNGPMWNEDPAKGFYDQAAIKSVIKRAYKQLPSSYEVERVIASDNETDIGMAGVENPVTSGASSSDLEALIDGRLEQESRRVPPGAATGRDPVEVGAGKTEGDAGAQKRDETRGEETRGKKPAGTPDIKSKLIAKIEAATDAEIAALLMDEASLHEWPPEDLAEINQKFLAKQASLAG